MRITLIFGMGIVLLAGCGQSVADVSKKGSAPGGFATPVVAVEVTPRLIEDKIPVVGSLSPNEEVAIKSRVEGTVEEIHFEEGQVVQKGDVLIVLDRIKLQASLDEAKANFEMAQTTLNRMSTLVEGGAVSKQEYDQAKADVAAKKAQDELIGAQLQDTIISASFDGTVGQRRVSLGQVIAKDTTLTSLVNTDPMKVDFHVPERYIGRLQLQQVIELKVAAYPQELFKGEVYFIDPQVEQTTRTVLVKARVPNPEAKLRSGMFAKLDVVIEQKPDALVIPETALILNGEAMIVYIVDQDNKAQVVPVVSGLRFLGEVEIVSGLKAGDKIITEGYQKVGPGSPVQVSAPEKF